MQPGHSMGQPVLKDVVAWIFGEFVAGCFC